MLNMVNICGNPLVTLVKSKCKNQPKSPCTLPNAKLSRDKKGGMHLVEMSTKTILEGIKEIEKLLYV